MALFGEDIKKRIHAATAGENGGKHSRFYEVLIKLDEDYRGRMDYTTSMFAKKESYLQSW